MYVVWQVWSVEEGGITTPTHDSRQPDSHLKAAVWFGGLKMTELMPHQQQQTAIGEIVQDRVLEDAEHRFRDKCFTRTRCCFKDPVGRVVPRTDRFTNSCRHTGRAFTYPQR